MTQLTHSMQLKRRYQHTTTRIEGARKQVIPARENPIYVVAALVGEGGSPSSDWADIENKPTEFPPSAHTHYVPNTVVTTETLSPAGGNDFYAITAQNGPLFIDNPSGTWADGFGFVIRLKDDGTARGISFGANYRACGQPTLPTTTVAGKEMYISVARNAGASKYDVFPAQIQP